MAATPYPPTLFYRGDDVEECTSWDEHWNLLFDGWLPSGPAPERPPFGPRQLAYLAEGQTLPERLSEEGLSATYATKGEIPTGAVSSPSVQRIIASDDPNEPLTAGDLLLVYAPPFTTFNALSTLTGLTEKWVDGAWAIAADGTATDGQALQLTGGSVARRGISLNNVEARAARADVEVVARIKVGTVTDTLAGGLVVRGQGGIGAESGYVTGVISSTGLQISRYVNGAYTQMGSFPLAYTASGWYWIRFRVVGNTQKARAWVDGAAEPTTWQIETASSAVTGVGWVGPYSAAGITATYDSVGVGLDGATAPVA